MCDHNSFKKDAVDRVISTKGLVGLDEFLERVFSFSTRPSHTAVYVILSVGAYHSLNCYELIFYFTELNVLLFDLQ